MARETDSVILFHSLSGKDSIALLDLIQPKFKRVACVYEYIVKDMRSMNIYADYARRKYKGIEFYQVPHYVVFTYIVTGCYGMEKDPLQKVYSFNDIVKAVSKEIGIEWSCFGFKQSDGLNRKVMLRNLDFEAINWKTKKFYPLSTYRNGDIMKYITANNLKKPIQITKGEASCGCCIDMADYMTWLKANYPDDYEKTIQTYPKTQFVIKLDEEDKKQREAGDFAWAY